MNSIGECQNVLSRRIIVVGDLDSWRAQGRDLPQADEMRFAEFSDISSFFLARHKPDVILAPLCARGFDALELTNRLASEGYQGGLRFLAPDIPVPEIILMELSRLAPDIEIKLIEISKLQSIVTETEMQTT
ncbi:hypothetical protein [Cochlodiniinecator piscidefendens]|uniref:hypothetical protein n=1 Tax=Cochlodiniinecator piscidefendens TaxID=2715756 RepID=UPI001409C885|nr:hypothetical protein [Cochlodiniinecator piscidefendens]